MSSLFMDFQQDEEFDNFIESFFVSDAVDVTIYDDNSQIAFQTNWANDEVEDVGRSTAKSSKNIKKNPVNLLIGMFQLHQ